MAKTRWIGWTVALAGVLMIANAAAASKSAAEKGAGDTFQWSKAIPVGKEIEIKGVNGGITASRATGKEVEVHATKHAKRSDPADVTIEVIEHEDGVTICAATCAPPATRGAVTRTTTTSRSTSRCASPPACGWSRTR